MLPPCLCILISCSLLNMEYGVWIKDSGLPRFFSRSVYSGFAGWTATAHSCSESLSRLSTESANVVQMCCCAKSFLDLFWKSAQSCSSLNVDLKIQIKAPDFENLGLHLKRESNVLDTLECLFVGLILFIVKLQTWWANWVISQGY